jgi:hypothetical protein
MKGFDRHETLQISCHGKYAGRPYNPGELGLVATNLVRVPARRTEIDTAR